MERSSAAVLLNAAEQDKEHEQPPSNAEGIGDISANTLVETKKDASVATQIAAAVHSFLISPPFDVGALSVYSFEILRARLIIFWRMPITGNHERA